MQLRLRTGVIPFLMGAMLANSIGAAQETAQARPAGARTTAAPLLGAETDAGAGTTSARRLPDRAGDDRGPEHMAWLTNAEGRIEQQIQVQERVGPVGAAPAGGQPTILGGALCPGTISTNRDPEGDMPREVAFTRDGRFALVVNRDTNNLAFFDPIALETVELVDVGSFPVHVSVTPDGRYALTANVFSNDVSVVDVETRTLAATIPVTGAQPYRVVPTADGQHAVVGVINSGEDATFSIIDLATLSEVRSFPGGAQGVYGGFFTPESGISGNLFTTFAVSPDGRTIALPDRFNSRLLVFDLETGRQTHAIDTAALPQGIDISRNGKFAVLSHDGAVRALTVVDLRKGRVSRVHGVSEDLVGGLIRLTADNRSILAGILNNVLMMDRRTGQVSARLFTGSPGDIELSFDGRFAFVANATSRVVDVTGKRIVASLPLAACVETAVSPVDFVAVALNNRFREDIHAYTFEGESGQALGRTSSGAWPEGDAPRTLAITPDGRTALVVHNTGDNVALIDVATGVVEDYLPTGNRSLGVAVTPDGSTAVVASGGTDTVSVIDLTARAVVATVPVAQTPTEVVIAPNGRFAYVTTVGGTDRVHFVRLDGAESRVVAALPTGQLGLITYTYNVFSGMALSPDGGVLAICVSFDDQLLLIDTAQRSEIARVPVGDFPLRAAFTPDGGHVYVTHAFSQDVRVVSVTGPNSRVVRTIGGIPTPLSVVFEDDGDFAYVGSFDNGTPRVVTIDADAMQIVARTDLPGPPREIRYSAAPPVLHVACAGGHYARLRAAGAATSLFDSIELAGDPSDLVYSPSLRTAVAAMPAIDAVDVIRLAAPGNFDCESGVNLDDFRRFADCLRGPGGGVNDGCKPADADMDGDVDLADAASMQNTFDGG